MTKPCIHTSAGEVYIISFWEFISKVEHYIVPKARHEIALAKKAAWRVDRLEPDLAVVESTHILKMNPIKTITELRKTTTKVERKSKKVDLIQVVCDLSYESRKHLGYPSYLFPIGEHRYALVCEGDVKLYTNEDFSQSLICTVPERNFTIYAPYGKF